MAYQIDRYNNTILTVVEDGTIDRTTDLKFIGKNYAGYGEIQNENFLYLLENFSGGNPPPRALSGQVWFNNVDLKLKLYDGSQWKTIGGAEVSSTEPTGLVEGDLWWDSENEQLYGFNGNDFVLIGPQAAGEGLTQMRSLTVKDLAGNDKFIIAATINTEDVIFVISADEFTLNSSTPITGYDRIRRGVTLVNTTLTTNGLTSSEHRFWGTASNADKLGGAGAEDFVTQANPDFENQITTSDSGISIGEGLDLNIYIENNDVGVIENSTGSSSEIIFKTTNLSGTVESVFSINYEGVFPVTDSSIDLGSATKLFDNVYANSFVGEATKASTLKVGSEYRSASASNTPNTIVSRDGSADVYANTFVGTALEAIAADLAENYTCADGVQTGSVMFVCEHSEHEMCEVGKPLDYPMGVVSDNPALLMNKYLNGTAIALKGRVPVRVVGPVKKGQRVYAFNNGCAKADDTLRYVVGVALETNTSDSEKLVECALNFA